MKKHKRITRIFAVLAVITVLIGSLALPIGAEDATETTTTELPTYPLPFDWSAYPSANLLDVNTATIWTNNSNKNNEYLKAERYGNGIKITALKTKTESWNRCGFTLGLTKDFLGKTLTVSVGQVTYSNPTEYSSPTIGTGICTHNNYNISDQNNMINIITKRNKTLTFTVPTDANYTTHPYLKIYFYPSYGGTFNTDETVIYEDIMVNTGDVAYPFIPYMPYYVQEAYDTGHSEALGKNECDRSNHIVYNSELYTDKYNLALTKEIIADFTDEEKHLFAIGYADAAAGNGTYHYTCCANKSWLYAYGDEIYWLDQGYKEGQWEALGLYDCNWHDIAPNDTDYIKVYNDAYDECSTTYTGLTEAERWLYAQGWADYYCEIGFHFTCCAEKNEAYLMGYRDSSYLLGQNEGYIEGYDYGERKGYLQGKEEGLKIAETGTWENLIGAVVEAPVNAFQGLFNFEIMGLNMQAAFGSMLAICVLLIIVKKVVM